MVPALGRQGMRGHLGPTDATSDAVDVQPTPFLKDLCPCLVHGISLILRLPSFVHFSWLCTSVVSVIEVRVTF